jgi:predicted enzyme related to lactoylglutathione lyase
MTDTPPCAGRFVWYELVATDKEAAKKFYAALLGWQWQDEDMGDLGVYPMAHTGETFHCGIISSQEGMPPRWVAYVSVPDVDEACALAEELGGAVMVPGTDIPNVGRFAALQDPGGAVIMPFQGNSASPAGEPDPAPAGSFCWHELLTPDPAGCVDFYCEIFGWTVEASEMPEMGTYWVFRRGDKMEGGMMSMPPEAGAPPHWLPYVAVDDVEASAAKVVELGGKVYCEPTVIPDMGRFAVACDDQGAVFALFQNA